MKEYRNIFVELINKKVGDFPVDNINQNAKRLFEIAK